MNLISLLLQTSRVPVLLAILTGLCSGGGSARLIALINGVINDRTIVTPTFLWGFFGLLLFVLITGFASQLLLIQIAQDALFSLRLLLSRRILACPLRYLEELGTHRLLAALTGDIEAIASAFTVIPFLCIDFAIVGGSLIYLCWLSWDLFLIFLAFIGFATVSYQFIARRARRFLTLAREEQDQLFNHFRAIVQGTKELKLHYERRQIFLRQELQQTAATSRRHNVMGMGIFAAAASWGQLLFFVVLMLFLFGLPQWRPIANPVLASYILTSIYLAAPLENLMRRLPILSRASVAFDKVESFGLMLNSHAIELEPSSLVSNLTLKSLELRHITHTYRGDREDDRFVLGPIHLMFQPGELVFIVGGNGSGKSTLAKLMVGLYSPEQGEIYFNHEPITDLNREWYRQHFSAIFSDFYLFERLLALDSPQLDTQTKQYLTDLQLDHKVRVESGVLSTTSLSQGQRKRLALLTTYLEDRPIYLFDEWASDQDPQFREIFYTEILLTLKRQGKLVLVISHDDKYFHLADRMIKLDFGQIIGDTQPSRNP